MKKSMLVAAALVSATLAGEAAAQSPVPLSVQAHVETAFPVGDFGDVAETGFGYGGSVAVQIVPAFALYGGYTRTTFGVEGAEDAELVDSGFSAGVTTALPGVAGLAPYAAAGLVFHDLEAEGDGAGMALEADADLGFELAGGVAVPIAPRVRLVPAVSYQRFGASFLGLDTDVQHLSLVAALNVSF